MRRTALRKFIITAAAALVPWTGPTFAKTAPVVAFYRFGLVGTWSPDCTRAPAPDNPRVRWAVVGGAIIHTVTLDSRTTLLVDTVGRADILGGTPSGSPSCGQAGLP